MRTSLALACAAPALLVLLAAPAAFGQEVAAAEALFNRAIADMDAGRYDTACPALAESQRLDPRSGTLFALATCQMKAGKIATAKAFFDDYLRSAGDLPAAARAKHADRMKIARAELARLAPLIPTLKLVLPPSAPADARVHRDGVDLSAAALGVALPVDPGEHVVRVEAPGRAPAEVRFTVEKGEAKVVELGVGAVPAAPVAAVVGPAPLAAASAGEGSAILAKRYRIGAYAAGGLGAAFVVVGAVTGGLALSKKSTVNADCKGLTCSAEGQSAVSAGQRLGNVSTAMLILGGAELGGAGVLYYLGTRKGVTTGGAPPSAYGQGRLGVGAGPGGFSIQAQGVW